MITAIQNIQINPSYKKSSPLPQKALPQLSYLSKFSNLPQDKISFGDYTTEGVSASSSIEESNLTKELITMRADALEAILKAKEKYTSLKDGDLKVSFKPDDVKVTKTMYDGKEVSIYRHFNDLNVRVTNPVSDKSSYYEVNKNGEIHQGNPYPQESVTSNAKKEQLQEYVTDILDSLKAEK